MDTYVKAVLTIVAIGVIGLNIQTFKTSNEIQKVRICGPWIDSMRVESQEVYCVNVLPHNFSLSSPTIHIGFRSCLCMPLIAKSF